MGCYANHAQSLRQAGYRLTPQRLMVLEALYHHPGYATVDELWARVSSESSTIDLSTIYRTMHFLKEQGLVSELHSAAGATLYAAIREAPHAHAVCEGCGQIMHVEEAWLEELQAKLMREYGFSVDIANLEIAGLCEGCGKGQV